jgi:hypothetical protein
LMEARTFPWTALLQAVTPAKASVSRMLDFEMPIRE